MQNILRTVPWFVLTPLVMVAAGVLAGASYYFTGPLFHETCANERNLLTGEFEASNCGEGAKVAARRTATEEPTRPAPTPAGAFEDGDGETPVTTPTADGDAAEGILAAGQFRDGEPGHQGSGRAELQRVSGGMLNLFLSNFSVTNGPDLVVVLSTDPEGSRGSVSSGLTLGALKANNGSQNYAIPEGTDVSVFRSVIIYCKSFPTVFAYAPLEVPG
ncbi:MAG TPA: DM13 domain-containing protein [Tepidiformaceae bacterium]|nr:DM13 domain-containing protein [Tepidiformaceae bacterium]